MDRWECILGICITVTIAVCVTVYSVVQIVYCTSVPNHKEISVCR